MKASFCIDVIVIFNGIDKGKGYGKLECLEGSQYYSVRNYSWVNIHCRFNVANFDTSWYWDWCLA